MSGALAKFTDVLRMFADNTWDETLKLWRLRIDNGGLFPDEALRALDAVLAAPPADLIERLFRDGWVSLHHDDADETPYSHDEAVAWLRERTDELRAELECRRR
jgi:hypothetical protein